MELESEYELVMEVIILGDASVGKSNVMLRYVQNKFEENSLPTIGCDYMKVNKSFQGKKFLIKFWDTAGQEKYRALSKNFYEKADAVILVYDVTNRRSLENADFWLKEISNSCKKEIKLLLLGNKNDLLDDRQVSKEEGWSWADKERCFYMEASAKTNNELRVNRAIDELLADRAAYLLKKEEERTNRETLVIKKEIDSIPIKGVKHRISNQQNCCK